MMKIWYIVLMIDTKYNILETRCSNWHLCMGTFEHKLYLFLDQPLIILLIHVVQKCLILIKPLTKDKVQIWDDPTIGSVIYILSALNGQI